MDPILWLVAVLVLLGIAFEAFKRFPFPANPPWIKQVIEGLLLVAFFIIIWDHFGLHLPGTH